VCVFFSETRRETSWRKKLVMTTREEGKRDAQDGAGADDKGPPSWWRVRELNHRWGKQRQAEEAAAAPPYLMFLFLFLRLFLALGGARAFFSFWGLRSWVVGLVTVTTVPAFSRPRAAGRQTGVEAIRKGGGGGVHG
jgi:hypothetical protein